MSPKKKEEINDYNDNINLEKTHYVVFHRARIKTKSSEISIRDNKISHVSVQNF